MDDSDGSSTVAQTLTGALLGGLSGYLDSQATQTVATVPSPNTAYGSAGTSQATGGITLGGVTLSPVMLLGIAVVAYLLFKK